MDKQFCYNCRRGMPYKKEQAIPYYKCLYPVPECLEKSKSLMHKNDGEHCVFWKKISAKERKWREKTDSWFGMIEKKGD